MATPPGTRTASDAGAGTRRLRVCLFEPSRPSATLVGWVLLAAIALPVGSALAGPPAHVAKLGGEVTPATGGGVEVRVRVEIARGYHINAHRPDADFLIPTVLTLSAEGATFETPTYPDPVARAFSFSEGKKLLVYDGAIDISARSSTVPTAPVQARLRYQACDDERCLPPKTVEAFLALPGDGSATATGASTRGGPGTGTNRDPGGADSASGLSKGAAGGEKAPWLARWLEGASLPAALAMTLVLGLTLNLTPCVYPLISVTLGYFGGQARPGARPWPLALAYVLGITLSFAVIGVSASFFGGLIGAPLQHPVVLIALAAVFVALAASSFGLFEIRAPQALLSRFGGSSSGIGGAVLMGLTMGIVAAPCIGPVVLGLIVYVGSQRDLALGLVLFLTMGFGMGLPYIALASAAGSIARLPRSGEWLRWMNRLFGVLLLAMALYFVSPLLDDALLRVVVPLFIAIVGLYLGFLEPSGRALRGFTAMRRVFGAAALVFAVWVAFSSGDVPAGATAGRSVRIRWEPLTVAALDRAIDSGRPAIVEFAADWCLPCAAMERTTFADPDVAREAERFSTLRADVTESSAESDALLGRFQVLGVPTIIFYGADGIEVDRVVGYVDADRFAAILRQIDGPDDDPRAPEAQKAAAPDAAASGRAS